MCHFDWVLYLVVGIERLVVEHTSNSFVWIFWSMLFVEGRCIRVDRLMYVPEVTSIEIFVK